MGVMGVVFLFAIGVIFSSARRSINWRTVLCAFVTQLFIAFFTLKVPVGQDFLFALSSVSEKVISAGEDGISFVFGALADTEKMGFIFFCRVLPIIIFVSSLVSVLYLSLIHI